VGRCLARFHPPATAYAAGADRPLTQREIAEHLVTAQSAAPL
jgi:hypothetical protein